MKRVTIVLADDHQIVRDGLKSLLASEPGFELVGEAGDGLEAVRLVEQCQPHVLVLDLMMSGLNGMDVARQVSKRAPQTKIIILSMHANESYVAEAFRAGAVGYVLKDSSATELIRAIHEGLEDRRYISPPLSEHAVTSYLKRASAAPLDPYHTLTAREREVLQLTAEGHSGGEIARRLFISPRTVETHRANLMRKLSLRNQKELVRYAVERGHVNADPSQPRSL